MPKLQDTSSSTSGPLPVVSDEKSVINELRQENAQLQAELANLRSKKPVDTHSQEWESAMQQGITYANGKSSTSAQTAGHLLQQLTGISKQRMKEGLIPDSSEFDYLPLPSADEEQLEADFIRWGYCLVKDAMSHEQVKTQVDRLVEQAAQEREQENWIQTSRNGQAQLVNNLVLKGQVFRDAVEFKESVAQNGPLVDRLLTKVMGEGFGLGCAHGSIVHQGGGLQEIHIDQGGMPMPYPPFPFGSLIIWCYTDFNFENGATYVVPGSHRTASGSTKFREGVNLIEMIEGEPGLVALCAPPGTCILTDTRILHCGGRRLAEGTRYAMRCHYNRHFIRALHEQSSANLHVPSQVYELLSDRLKHMMGISIYNPSPIGELRK